MTSDHYVHRSDGSTKADTLLFVSDVVDQLEINQVRSMAGQITQGGTRIKLGQAALSPGNSLSLPRWKCCAPAYC